LPQTNTSCHADARSLHSWAIVGRYALKCTAERRTKERCGAPLRCPLSRGASGGGGAGGPAAAPRRARAAARRAAARRRATAGLKKRRIARSPLTGLANKVLGSGALRALLFLLVLRGVSEQQPAQATANFCETRAPPRDA
jgi:hypothetical protein